jgi:hypothetical protein
LIDIASASKRLDGRVQVVAILGDYTDVAERFQFGLYETIDGEFPTLFERVHLSNIPRVSVFHLLLHANQVRDYTNGHLSTFLYAMPVVSRTLGSMVTANCL